MGSSVLTEFVSYLVLVSLLVLLASLNYSVRILPFDIYVRGHTVFSVRSSAYIYSRGGGRDPGGSGLLFCKNTLDTATTQGVVYITS